MRLLATIIFLHFSVAILAQEHSSTSFSEDWEDISIPDLETPIHKMYGFGEHLWGVDYGNGYVLKSENNGKDWNRIAHLGSEYFEAIQFLDLSNGYVCGDYGFVYKTTDGGASWKEISPKIDERITERYRNDSTKNQKPEGVAIAYYSMYFQNKDKGYVSGFKYLPKESFRESFERIFYKTDDGGVTWELLEKEHQTEFLEALKNEIKRENISLEGNYYLKPEQNWKTGFDKERNHIVVRNSSDTLVLPKTDYKRIMLRHISFLDEDKGYIFGGSLDENNQKAVIYETLNNGDSWQLKTSSWSHIHYAFRHNGYLWVSGKEGLLKRKKI